MCVYSGVFFFKLRGAIGGVPMKRIRGRWGLDWGPPKLGNYHIYVCICIYIYMSYIYIHI